jgi:hypothetical protein
MNDTHISNLTAAIDRLTEAVQNLAGAEPTITLTQTYSPPSYVELPPAAGVEVETVASTPVGLTPTIHDLRNIAQALLDKGRIVAIQKVNAAHGIKRLTEAQPDQYVSLQTQLLKELE